MSVTQPSSYPSYALVVAIQPGFALVQPSSSPSFALVVAIQPGFALVGVTQPNSSSSTVLHCKEKKVTLRRLYI